MNATARSPRMSKQVSEYIFWKSMDVAEELRRLIVKLATRDAEHRCAAQDYFSIRSVYVQALRAHGFAGYQTKERIELHERKLRAALHRAKNLAGDAVIVALRHASAEVGACLDGWELADRRRPEIPVGAVVVVPPSAPLPPARPDELSAAEWERSPVFLREQEHYFRALHDYKERHPLLWAMYQIGLPWAIYAVAGRASSSADMLDGVRVAEKADTESTTESTTASPPRKRRRERRTGRRAGRPELSPKEREARRQARAVVVLRILRRNPEGLSLKELRKRAKIGKTQLRQVLAGLEAVQRVVYVKNGNDSRYKMRDQGGSENPRHRGAQG